jgi:diacylglycerol kinase
MAVGTNSNKTRIDSFKFASGGLIHALINQRNFQIQIVIGIVVIIGAWLLHFSRIEWLILILTVGLVLASELINTVVEIVVDLAVKERLIPDAKIAKDVAAAAVLLTSIFAVILGLILFIPHFL